MHDTIFSDQRRGCGSLLTLFGTKNSLYGICISGNQARIYATAAGARAQGGVLKKLRCRKKVCPRERNLRKIYTENNVGILEAHYNVLSFVSFLCCYKKGGRKVFLGPGA
jgi:hypothetical protein